MQTIQLPDATYEAALRLAGDSPVESVIAEAVEALRRMRLLDEINAGFAALRSDPEAWAAELEERRETEGAIGDGLEGD